MARPTYSVRRILDRLRSNESPSALAADLGVRDAEVALARDLVRHIGEHQAPAAGRLPDALAQAVVEAALQIEHAGFLKAVAEGGTKAAASAARRGLAILRSRGIDVELAPTGAAVFKAEPAADELPCYLSTPDSAGDRVLWMPRTLRGGGVQLLTVLLSDTAGIVHVEETEVSRKSLRRIREEIGRPAAVTLVEIPRERATGTLAAARAQTPGLGIEAQALLTNLVGDAAHAAAPTESEPPFAPEVEAARIDEGAKLCDEPEVRSWKPDVEALRALALRLQEIASSQLYLSEEQRAEQRAREIERAVDAFFEGARRARYARRLFELAEGLRGTAREHACELALATARALRGTSSASAISFCRALFERAARALEAAAPASPGFLPPQPSA